MVAVIVYFVVSRISGTILCRCYYVFCSRQIFCVAVIVYFSAPRISLIILCNCYCVFRRLINFARSCVSHESQFISQIASYCIHFARCYSPMGLNILFCADRFKTNIDAILHGSSSYIVHSNYNRSIADVQLHASSFLLELISTRDSRQSYFGTSPKRS